MKEILQNTIEKIGELQEVRYVDENWGQLDYYSSNPPTQWPCALVDIQSGKFSNIGKDRSKTPQNRQMAELQINIRIANIRLGNTSLNAPQSQKDQVWSIWELIESIHEKLHGFEPTVKCSKLIRVGFARITREDGVQEYSVSYSSEVTDV